MPLGALRLVGFATDREVAAPGDPVLVNLYWLADTSPANDESVHLRLIAPDGSEAASYQFSPAGDDLPPSEWVPGDLWRGQRLLRLPAGLQSGEHVWEIELCRPAPTTCAAAGQAVTLSSISVNAPLHTWEVPPLDVEDGTQLGGLVTLLGAQLQPDSDSLSPGSTLTITLVWRADAEIDTSYRVFVHLLDHEGAVRSQSDGEPSSWTRPTTGWLPGEIILDEHVLVVPEDASGEHALAAGLYTLESGRLLTLEGLDHITLMTGLVEETTGGSP